MPEHATRETVESTAISRRTFIGILGAGLLSASHGAAAVARTRPRVSITIDDPTLDESPLVGARERDERILAAIAKRRGLGAALFVCGKRVDSGDGAALLDRWRMAGHLIGNHSYSHPYYHGAKMTFEAFAEDTERGDAIIARHADSRRYFRFPYLKEGNTVEKRDAMRRFLADRSWRNGHVTIDASDWYVDQRMRKRLESDPRADLAPYRTYYLDHIWNRARYYDNLARLAVGRSPAHTLLLHHNLLNALFLGDLLAMFEQRGWALVDAEEAYEDPFFDREPSIVPAGESLVWALAKETGRFEAALRYPAEDGRYEKAAMDKLGL